MVKNNRSAPTLAAVLMRVWMQRGPLALLLWPLAQLFGAVAALRRAAYAGGVLRAVRLPVPVIVVGNLFVGGTGKTPLTIWMVEALRHAGFHPGVISRGYGNHAAGDAVRAVHVESNAAVLGDEPVLIVRRTGCALVVGRDRVAAATALLAANPGIDVIISDDGLQHYRMQRDIEIVLGDGRGNGNGWLLPAGPLREPVSRRRDFTVINFGATPPQPAGPPTSSTATRRATAPATTASPSPSPSSSSSSSSISSSSSTVPIPMTLALAPAEQLRDRQQRMALPALAAMRPGGVIVAAAGMGNPTRFFDSLVAAGLASFSRMPLPDHHVFDANTFADCAADLILITEKDAVKCQQIVALATDARLWVVPVSAQLPQTFADNIVERLRGYAIA